MKDSVGRRAISQLLGVVAASALIWACTSARSDSSRSSDLTAPPSPAAALVPFTPTIDCGGGASCQLTMDVTMPAQGGQRSLILLVPGGPQPLEEEKALLVSTLGPALAQRGAVVMTIQWRQGPTYGAAFPADLADVACAIGVARSVGPSYGADPSKLTLVGHSLGAWAGAVLVLTQEEYTPADGACARTAGALRPDRFVSVAGALDPKQKDDISIGDQLGVDPARLAAADPFALIEQYPAAKGPLPITLIHGTADSVVPPEVSRRFRAAANAQGYAVPLVEVPDADHHDVLVSPRTIDTIASVATSA